MAAAGGPEVLVGPVRVGMAKLMIHRSNRNILIHGDSGSFIP